MTDALKPCPFCGTAARFDWEERRGQNFYYAVCPNEECVARMGTDYCETKAAAAAIWNRRLASCVSVPDGWKLVPVEPTMGMYDDWLAARKSQDGIAGWQAGYAAMLAAAPEVKP